MQELLYLQFKFVDADAIFVDSSCLLKNTKHINITYVKHAAKIHTTMPIECIDCARHTNKKRNQMVNLVVTEVSAHSQATYYYRNSKSQLVPVKLVNQLMYRSKLP